MVSAEADLYLYLAGVSPFRGAGRDEVLLARLGEHLADGGNLAMSTAVFDPVTRPLPPVHDVPSYVEFRLTGQLNGYYRPAARRMARRSALVSRTAVALSLLAAVLTGVSAAFGYRGLTAWVAVATTVATAVVGFGAAERYEYRQLEYTRTADQLDRLAARTWPLASEAEDQLVAESERVISTSNEGWMAKIVGQQAESAPDHADGEG